MPGLPTPPQGESALALVESPWPQSASLDLRTRRDSRDGPFLATRNNHCPKHSSPGPSGEPCSSLALWGGFGHQSAKLLRWPVSPRCWHHWAHPGSARSHLRAHPSHMSGAWRRLFGNPPKRKAHLGVEARSWAETLWKGSASRWRLPTQPGPPQLGMSAAVALLGKKLRKPWDSRWTLRGQWPWYSGLSSGKRSQAAPLEAGPLLWAPDQGRIEGSLPLCPWWRGQVHGLTHRQHQTLSQP